MGKETSFWIGGLSSGAVYFLILFFLFYNIVNKPKKIAMLSDGGMQVSVVIDSKQIDKKIPVEQVSAPLPPKIEQKPDEFAEKVQVIKKIEPPKQLPIENKERPLDAKALMKQAIKQEPQPQKQEQQKPVNAKSIISSLDLKKNSLSVSFSSSGEFDAYLNKIAQLIRAGWNPYSSDSGLSATISMNINGDGNFYFKIKSSSSSSDFDLRLNEYLKTLQLKGLPAPDNHKNVSVDFNFKAMQ